MKRTSVVVVLALVALAVATARAEIIERVKIRTRQFAKRQLTWFRAQKNLEWIELKPDDSPEKWLPEISRVIRNQTGI